MSTEAQIAWIDVYIAEQASDFTGAYIARKRAIAASEKEWAEQSGRFAADA